MPLPLPASRAHLWFVFLGVLITAVWMEFDRLGWETQLLWLIGVFLIAKYGTFLDPTPTSPTSSEAKRLVPTPFAWVVVLPACSYLALTAFQEFPFSGDHAHHLLANDSAIHFWKRHIFLVPIVCWLWTLGLKRLNPSPWVSALGFATLLIAWSYLGGLPAEYFARYPGGGYLLSFPWALLARWFVPEHFELGARFSHLLALIAWLAVLRPFLLNRKPDLVALAVGSVLFFQPDFIYYFTSSYLEPWALILVLTAIESLLIEDQLSHWLPALLVGAAALFKEQSILVLPWVVTAQLFIRRPISKPDWAGASINGVAAVLPFLIYFSYRNQFSFFRERVSLLGSSEILSADRLDLWLSRVTPNWGYALALFGAALLVCLWARRASLLLLWGAGATQVVFFWIDRVSLHWTGYSRFHLMAALLTLAPASIYLSLKNSRASIAIAVLAVSLHVPQTYALFKNALLPDSNRTFIEHVDAPVFFPVRSLFSQALKEGALKNITVVHSVPHVTNSDYFSLGYPTLNRDVRLVLNSNPDCRCKAPNEGVFMAHSGRPLESDCVERFRQTCRRVFFENDGTRVWGALGVGTTSK